MKENTIAQRLKVVVAELQHGSRARFGQKVGLSTSDVRQLIAGVRKADAALVDTILTAYPELSGRWLVEGQGQMLVANKWMDADTESKEPTPAPLSPAPLSPAPLSPAPLSPAPLSEFGGRLARVVEYFCFGNKASFAKLTGVNYQGLVNIMAGRKSAPSFADLQKIRSAMPAVNLEWLLLGAGEMLAADKQGGEPAEFTTLYLRASNLPAGVGVVTLLYLDLICQNDSEPAGSPVSTLFLQQLKQLPYRLKKGATVAVALGYCLKVGSTHLDLESNLYIVEMAPALVSTSEEQALILEKLLNCGWQEADFGAVGHNSLF